MRILITFVMMFLAVATSAPQAKQEDFGLPQLHMIETITLSPAYSCRPEADFMRGYEETALFLSSYSRRRNIPDLLFNGACGVKDNFESTDMGVIADLGISPLEKLSAHLAFNVRNIASFELYSRFAKSVPVQANHTYAVLIDSGEIRGLFLFSVTGYVPNNKVDLKYAVKQYQIISAKAESPGFDWTQENIH
jgi:hypothetical protein